MEYTNRKTPAHHTSEKHNKECVIRVRVTSEEQERFRTKAKELGYRSVSAYIRSLVNER